MNEQGRNPFNQPRPHATDGRAIWQQYWQALGQPWRTEPEIDQGRQQFLAARRAIKPDIEQEIYPFKDIEPSLARADLEWLLSTHEDGRGPVAWSDERQHTRIGLDMRGAMLRGIDIRGLPLARLRGGLTWDEWQQASDHQRGMATVRINHNLEGTFLQGAILRGMHLTGGLLTEAHLEEADLAATLLDSSILIKASLQGANLVKAYLSAAILDEVLLQGANLQQAVLLEAYLEQAHLEEADLRQAHMNGATLCQAHLEGADLRGASLKAADLRGAFLDRRTQLQGVIFGDERQPIGPCLADVSWGGVDLRGINWETVQMLRDEDIADQEKTVAGKRKDVASRISEYQAAERAYLQLVEVLQGQGAYESALRFAERAQLVHEKLLALGAT
jgi:uncharacterized protein YjbI with pentapeptide repeats